MVVGQVIVGVCSRTMIFAMVLSCISLNAADKKSSWKGWFGSASPKSKEVAQPVVSPVFTTATLSESPVTGGDELEELSAYWEGSKEPELLGKIPFNEAINKRSAKVYLTTIPAYTQALKTDFEKLRAGIDEKKKYPNDAFVQDNLNFISFDIQIKIDDLRKSLPPTARNRAYFLQRVEKLSEPGFFEKFLDSGHYDLLTKALNEVESHKDINEEIVAGFTVLESMDEGLNLQSTLSGSAINDKLVDALTVLNDTVDKLSEGELQQATLVKPRGSTVVDSSNAQINRILSWPTEKAKDEKIAALQLLAAHADIASMNRGQLRQALSSLGAKLPAPHFVKDGKIEYSIPMLGRVTEKQLKDYAESGKGDLLKGFCSSLGNLGKTVKRYESDPRKFNKKSAEALYRRYMNSYKICSYIQGTPESEKVKAVVRHYTDLIKRVPPILAVKMYPVEGVQPVQAVPVQAVIEKEGPLVGTPIKLYVDTYVPDPNTDTVIGRGGDVKQPLHKPEPQQGESAVVQQVTEYKAGENPELTGAIIIQHGDPSSRATTSETLATITESPKAQPTVETPATKQPRIIKVVKGEGIPLGITVDQIKNREVIIVEKDEVPSSSMSASPMPVPGIVLPPGVVPSSSTLTINVGTPPTTSDQTAVTTTITPTATTGSPDTVIHTSPGVENPDLEGSAGTGVWPTSEKPKNWDLSKRPPLERRHSGVTVQPNQELPRTPPQQPQSFWTRNFSWFSHNVLTPIITMPGRLWTAIASWWRG